MLVFMQLNNGTINDKGEMKKKNTLRIEIEYK